MIKPPLLKPQGKAVIIAPAGEVQKYSIDKAIAALQQWGLDVTLGDYVYASDGVFAGTDIERLSDLQKALDDPQISLILCARGGYGLTRIIERLSFTRFYKFPKWVVGFSDITAFHLKTLKKDILSIHGPMGTSFNREGAADSLLHLRELLMNGSSVIAVNLPQLRVGVGSGVIVGGNLSLICDSLGTPSEIETKNKILVLEDVGDYYYRIDRMLNQLNRAGKLKDLCGLIIGSFSDMLNGQSEFSESINEMIIRITANYSYPISISFPIGHEPQNFPFVHGAEYRLEVKKDSAQLKLETKL